MFKDTEIERYTRYVYETRMPPPPPLHFFNVTLTNDIDLSTKEKVLARGKHL